jgi:hypothetical protein
LKNKIYQLISLNYFRLIKIKKPPCNCGTITNDNIEFDSNNNIFYTLTITNDCSGNSGKYYFDYGVWLNANVGENFCITNVSSWMPLNETTIQRVENKHILVD